MTGAPSDSYMGGLFRTASSGNLSRRQKASGQGYVFGGQKAQTIKRNLDRLRMDNFARQLENGVALKDAAKAVGVSPQTGSRIFKQICDGLGPQAR